MAPAIWGPNVTGGGTAHPYLPPWAEKNPICRGLLVQAGHRNPVIEPNPHVMRFGCAGNAPKAQVVLSRCCPRNSPKVTAS